LAGRKLVPACVEHGPQLGNRKDRASRGSLSIHVAAQPTRARRFSDFTRWKDHDAYQKALDRLLRDLRVEWAYRIPAGGSPDGCCALWSGDSATAAPIRQELERPVVQEALCSELDTCFAVVRAAALRAAMLAEAYERGASREAFQVLLLIAWLAGGSVVRRVAGSTAKLVKWLRYADFCRPAP
jgi:hypothetical protein